ncbi:MAG: hypothetical protein ACRD8O_22570 [Bryobacteraceae bacterium]
MPGSTLSVHELAGLLERFPLERAGGRTFEEIADAHVQLLLARIAALTDLLRGAEPNETTHLASRLLLSDLTIVAAHFRGRANVMRPSLAKALAQLRESLARCEAPSGD